MERIDCGYVMADLPGPPKLIAESESGVLYRYTTPTNLLHHYTTGRGLLGIIKSGVLWATDIHYLNDEREFSYALDIAGDIIASLEQGASPEPARLLGDLREALRRIRSMRIFVGCFSERQDLLSQWRAYSGSGTGYNIGFSDADLEGPLREQGFRLAQCIYNRPMQEAGIKQIIDGFVAELGAPWPPHGSERWKQLISEFSRKFAEYAPVVKHPSFSEEREWRIISPPTDIRHPQIEFREGRHTLIPYFQFRLRPEPERLCSEVVVGPSAHREAALSAVASLVFRPPVTGSVLATRAGCITASVIPYREW